MRNKLLTFWILISLLLPVLIGSRTSALASSLPGMPAQSGEVSAYDLIIAMNTLRMSYGLPALVEDPIINAVAQGTAEIMAANQMSWHIGDVSGRLASAGYGGGAKVWATENFAVGGSHTIDEIMVVWADESHMIPAVNPAYCHVGAGTAKSANGMTYYVLQAAYVAGKSCGDYIPPSGNTSQPDLPRQPGVPQLIIPVKIAEPDEEGKVFHVVEPGQSFWAIAVAYQITIRDIEVWNNVSREMKLQPGQTLFIPGKGTEGYATPTPVGMILASTPDADGKIIHTVQSYQTLSTISQAYGTNVERLLTLNGIQEDWPLQIGQILLVHPGNVTPTPTPQPLTPIEKLTPESDGKYYHTVHSGETLSWIADLYNINMFDLMAWNGLNTSSILQPEQKLILQVTPPATITPTPGPATPTSHPTASPSPTATHTLTLVVGTTAPPESAESPSQNGRNVMFWFVSLGLAVGGLYMAVLYARRRQ